MGKAGAALVILVSCSIGGCVSEGEYKSYQSWVDSTWGVPQSGRVAQAVPQNSGNSLIVNVPSENSSQDSGPRSYYNPYTGRWYGDFNRDQEGADVQRVRDSEAYDEYRKQQQIQNERQNNYHLRRLQEMRSRERR